MPDLNGVSQAWLALIGAIVGGSGLKVIEHWLNKSKVKDDSAASFRKELRDEVTSLREELRKAEAGLDSWRDKYYALMDEFSAFKTKNLADEINREAANTARDLRDTARDERDAARDVRDAQ